MSPVISLPCRDFPDGNPVGVLRIDKVEVEPPPKSERANGNGAPEARKS